MSKLRVDKIAAPIVKDEYTGSVFFDGSGDYLSLPVSSDFQFGSGDFTIECWAYALDEGTDDILGIYNTGSNRRTFALRKDQTEAAQFLFSTDGSSGTSITSAASVIQLRTWHHYAVVRRNLVYELYFDGVKLATKSDSTGAIYTNNDDGLRIGSSYNTDFHGYISNVRICKGHAVYDRNFTPPTRELEVHLGAKGVVFPAADNRTVLLACQDAYNPLTEATGRHKITGAGSLGGVPGQNLVINDQFGQNTNNWSESGSISFTRDTTVFSGGGIKVTTGGGQSLVTQTLTGLVVGARYTFSADLYTPSSNPGTDVATISITNAGYNSTNAVSTDTNGVIQRKSFTFTASSTSQVIYLSVVRANYGTFAPSGSVGYFDNISVIVVTPTSEANPGLLRKTNITSTITETTGSVFFKGSSGEYLTTAGSSDFAFGTGDYTVEFWVYAQTTHTYHNIFDTRGTTSNSTTGFSIGYTSSNWYVYMNAFRIQTSVTLNAWTHLALTRKNGTHTLWINGANSGNDSTAYDFTNTIPYIGAAGASDTAQFIKGYVSNLRVCKGHAVYTSNFIPPSRELEVHEGPDDDRTVLLCCYDGENIFADKSGRHVIAAYGGRTSSPTPTATDSPIGSTTVTPGLTREVDPVEGPTFGGGAGFVSQNWLTLPKGTTTERMPVLGGIDSSNARGVFGGGYSTSDIEYIQISTLGNSSEFGDRVHANFARPAALSSSTRGLFAGGFTPNTYSNAIDYITISSTGDGKDFGDMSIAVWSRAGCSNSIRGILAGGYASSNYNVIDHLIIATTGNTQDFGDLTRARRELGGSSSTTRGIFMGGRSPVPSGVNNDEDIIDYITIASTGNAVDFGNLAADRSAGASCSNAIRSLYSGGNSSDSIEFVTIATLGDAVDFGDMNNALNRLGSCASSIRGIIAGGSPTNNTIEYVTIATKGDAQDFGDLSAGAKRDIAGLSNGHGGLG